MDARRGRSARFFLAITMVGAAMALAGLGLVSSTPEAEAQGAPVFVGRGAFSGVPPAGDGIALLLATEASSPAALSQTLHDAGCQVETLFVLGTPTPPIPGAPPGPPAWQGFIEGAPAAVNAGAPSSIPASTPFFVRCRGSVTPIVSPANASYLIDGGVVTLVNGHAERPAAPGSSSMVVTDLTARRSFGTLDGAVSADAAVVLRYSTGGSGTFSLLAGLTGGSSLPAPTIVLGDRISIESLNVAYGRITVTYLDRGPAEPLAIAPTIPVTRTFFLRGNTLIEASTPISCTSASLGDIGGLVIVTTPLSGSEVTSGFTVSGCSRTFESNFSWRLLGSGGTVLASGFSMGGGVDGPGPFSFTVPFTTTTRQLAHLEVFEPDISGLGLPRPRDTVPLIVGPLTPLPLTP